MKLSELVEVVRNECQVCVSYTYTLAHNIDKELCVYLRAFGQEKYPAGVIELFKIETPDWFVECMLGTKYVKIWMKKSLGGEIDVKVGLLRDCLTAWLSDKFNSDIERD